MLFAGASVGLVEVEITDGAYPVIMFFIQQSLSDVPATVWALLVVALLRGQGKNLPRHK